MLARKRNFFEESSEDHSTGFSLVEVILAVAIFAVTVLALVGLLGPTLQSVKEVETLDEVTSVADAVYTFIQTSPDIETTSNSRFEALYSELRSQGTATVFVFRSYVDDARTQDQKLVVGFAPSTKAAINDNAKLSAGTDFADAAGPIYRVILAPSSAIPSPEDSPTAYRSTSRNSQGFYTLTRTLANFDLGSLAIEAKIYVDESGPSFDPNRSLASVIDSSSPLLEYNIAILR